MKLADRAAELFMVGFYGERPTPELEGLIRQGLSGVILFARNLSTPEQVRALTGDLQALSPDLPLLIATDQEGGIVSRIAGVEPGRTGTRSSRPGRGMAAGTPWPGNMTLGACGDPALTRQVAAGLARELRALGINMNLAPVVDVNNNPQNPVIGVRSYGEDPERVAVHAEAAIQGLREGGVLSTAKHFPGHGDTAVDSHLALPVIPHDRRRLEAVELVPFRRAIAAGVDAIMTAHVVFSAMEPSVPATLSRAVLTGLLREELGYRGLVVTDCMEMKAIAGTVGTAEAAVRAILAGADLVLVSHTYSEQVRAIEAVRAAIESGRIPRERVEEALGRIRQARGRLVSLPPALPLDLLGCDEHLNLARSALAGSITAVWGASAAVPVDPGRTVLVAADPSPVTLAEEQGPIGSPVLEAMAEEAPEMRAIGVRRDPGPAEIQQVVEKTADADLVLVATYVAHLFPGQAELVRALRSAGRRVLLVPQRGPYDLVAIPDVLGAVVMYEDRLMAARAAVRYLLGRGDAPGKLPVTIPQRQA